MTLMEQFHRPEAPTMQYTTERNIFSKMDTPSLLIQHRNYVTALVDKKHIDSWPALKLGLELCLDELKKRGINVNQ